MGAPGWRQRVAGAAGQGAVGRRYLGEPDTPLRLIANPPLQPGLEMARLDAKSMWLGRLPSEWGAPQLGAVAAAWVRGSCARGFR